MIILISELPTTDLCKRNGQKRPILSEISDNKFFGKNDILFTFVYFSNFLKKKFKSIYLGSWGSYGIVNVVFGFVFSSVNIDIIR